jgi:hypothetical protein
VDFSSVSLAMITKLTFRKMKELKINKSSEKRPERFYLLKTEEERE